jgi:hypothetical protein
MAAEESPAPDLESEDATSMFDLIAKFFRNGAKMFESKAEQQTASSPRMIPANALSALSRPGIGAG